MSSADSEMSAEERQAKWWRKWFAADFSWEGLAKHEIAGDGGLHGEKTLQDYWRRDPETGVVRDDEAMRAAGELVEGADGRWWHVVHLPPSFAHGPRRLARSDSSPERGRLGGGLTAAVGGDGDVEGEDVGAVPPPDLPPLGGRDGAAHPGGETWKADLEHANWEKVEKLVDARVRAGVETNAKADGFGGIENEGLDGRAQLAGSVLRSGPAHHDEGAVAHVSCRRFAGLGGTDCTSRAFGEGADYSLASFAGAALFKSASFAGGARFTSATFAGAAVFKSASFAGAAEFNGASFAEAAVFNGASFAGSAVFNSASFAGSAVFNSASFDGDLVFTRASYSEDAEAVRFWGEASFAGVIAKGAASFAEARFDGPMKFDKARFLQIVDFSRVRFPGNESDWRGAFDGVLFESSLDLRTTVDDLGAGEAGDKSERKRKSDADRARTFGTSFAVSMLSGATLDRGVMLERISEKEEGPAHRAALNLARKAEDRERALRALESGALKLKLAMERESDMARAQRFYRLELRARRAQKDTNFWEKVFSYLFAGLSNYGGSVVRPFIALGILLAVTTVGFWAWANALAGWSRDDLLFGWEGRFDAAAFAWTNVFRPLSALADTEEILGDNIVAEALLLDSAAWWAFAVRVVATIESLLAIVLAFLFALAVRRRFQIS